MGRKEPHHGAMMSGRKTRKAQETFLLWNAFGGHNLGDEAILWALSRQLYRLYPNAKIYALVPRHALMEQAKAVYKEWRVEPVYGFWRVYFGALRQARLIVGGGHLVDNVSRGMSSVITSSFFFVNWLYGMKPMILFVGAERVTRFVPHTIVKWVYSLATIVTCRDPESTKALNESGIPKEKLLTAKDVVFSLDRNLVPQWKATTLPGLPRVAVVVAYDRRRMREPDTSSVKLIQMLLQSGYIVELIAHDIREDYDRGALLRVKSKLEDHPRLIVHHADTTAEAFEIYSRVDAVISGRMHPLIMAALAGTLPIAYGGRVKVKSLTEMSGIPTLRQDDPQREVDEIGQLLNQKAYLTERISQSIEGFRGEVEVAIEKAFAFQSSTNSVTARAEVGFERPSEGL